MRFYGNLTFLQTQYVLLTAGSSTVIQFSWNTTNFAKGSYEISAIASRPEGEVDRQDNILIFGYVLVTIPGDAKGDKTVNVLDLILIAGHLGHSNGNGHVPYSEEWYKCNNCDVKPDGKINVLDLIVTASHLGQHWP